MPSRSTAQQKLMGMAYALKKGDMDPSDASDEVKDLANNMTLQQLKDFASTKHEGLPDHVKEDTVNEWLPGVSAGQKWYTQPAQSAGEYGEYVKDHTDRLIKSFIEFIDTGKKPKSKNAEDQGEADASPLASIKEDAVAPSSFSAPQASVDNTPGMGDVEPGQIGGKGSGDTFGGSDDDEDDEEEKKKVGIMSYEKYKKWLKKWQMQNKDK